MKKTFALLLCICMLFLLCACESGPSATDLLCGTWNTKVAMDEDYVRDLLHDLSFDDAEIAYADLQGLVYVENITFRSDRTYSIATPEAETRALTRSWYADFFNRIYAHLSELEDVYGEGAAEYYTSVDMFEDFYAELFEVDSFDTLLDEFVEESFNFDAFDEETGTFTVESGKIHMTVTGASEAEFVTYTLVENTLTLTYAENEISVYTKVA